MSSGSGSADPSRPSSPPSPPSPPSSPPSAESPPSPPPPSGAAAAARQSASPGPAHDTQLAGVHAHQKRTAAQISSPRTAASTMLADMSLRSPPFTPPRPSAPVPQPRASPQASTATTTASPSSAAAVGSVYATPAPRRAKKQTAPEAPLAGQGPCVRRAVGAPSQIDLWWSVLARIMRDWGFCLAWYLHSGSACPHRLRCRRGRSPAGPGDHPPAQYPARGRLGRRADVAPFGQPPRGHARHTRLSPGGGKGDAAPASSPRLLPSDGAAEPCGYEVAGNGLHSACFMTNH